MCVEHHRRHVTFWYGHGMTSFCCLWPTKLKEGTLAEEVIFSVAQAELLDLWT